MLNKTDMALLREHVFGYLGSQLRLFRRNQRKSIQVVAKETGLSYEEIDEIEQGTPKSPNLDNAIRLAACYNRKIILDLEQIEERI